MNTTHTNEDEKLMGISFICNLPPYLVRDLEALVTGQQNHVTYLDCLEGEVYGSINAAYIDGLISEEQAWYLRERYLGMVKEQ